MNPVENSVQPLTPPPPRPSGPSPRSVRAFCGLTSLLAALAGFAWFSGTANPAHAQPLGRTGKLPGHPAVRALAPGLAPVTLPIEVMGADGTVVAVSVQVPPTPTPVVALWMQVHGLSYEDKASVQVNYGRWIPLNNQTAAVEEPGKSYGGIGGGFSTLKLSLPLRWPLARISKGFNRISFRFNHTDGVSTGFRVLKLQMLTAQGRPVLTPDSFVADDPGQWQPPLADDASAAAGATLWHTAQLNESSLVGAPATLATCSDCHAHDGRDLKYFNYSNYSIVERSKFHGLTQTQGEQIASYIRTLRNADGTEMLSPGRPWNPPYQPGPGLDSKPAAYWAAGAGVDAVLGKDSDLLDLLANAPLGTNHNLNMRETPIALQMLDWNHWLPTVHPKDAWGSKFTKSNLSRVYDGKGTGTGTPLRPLFTANPTMNPNSYVYLNQLNQAAELLLTPVIQDRSARNSWDGAAAAAVYSTRLWVNVKLWEIMNEFNLQDQAQGAFPGSPEARTWFTETGFRSSLSQNSIPAGPGFVAPNQAVEEYINNAWYQFQMVTNSGNHHPSGTSPVDPGYFKSHLDNLTQYTGTGTAANKILWAAKMMQDRDNGMLDTHFGWDLFVTDIAPVVGGSAYAQLDRLPRAQKAPVLTALVQTWFDKARTYSAQQYYALGSTQEADRSQVPRASETGNADDRIFFMIPRYYAQGVDPVLLSNVCDWAKSIWPLGDWDTLKLSMVSGGTVLASAAAPGPSGRGSYQNLADAPNAPYYVEFDVTERSYVDKDYALVSILDPSGSGRGYQFGLGTLYSANDLHVLLNRVSDGGAVSGQQDAVQFDARAAVGKTIHVRVEVSGQHFLLRASEPLPAPQTPFVGNYPYQMELKDSNYSIARAHLGVIYVAPAGVSADTGLHVSNWQVVQP